MTELIYDKVNSVLKHSEDNSLTTNASAIRLAKDRIKENSKCDWIEDLLTAVFVSHTKILTSIRRNNDIQKINIKVPKLEIFIHKCYIDIARFFYKNLWSPVGLCLYKSLKSYLLKLIFFQNLTLTFPS